MKEKSKKKEKKNFHIKELFLNKQYRSIIILVFYVVLFAILIIGLRQPKNMIDSGNGGSATISVKGYDLIHNNNFSYKYTVIMDEEEYVYEGKRYKNKDLVTITTKDESRDYYFDKDNYYVKRENEYKKTLTKPTFVFDYFNTSAIGTVIARSVFQEDKNQYVVDNQTLYDVLSDEDDRVEKGDNFIKLEYRNSYITKISFDVTNYANMLGERCSNATVVLEYFDFNLIDDFGEIEVAN